MELRLDGKVALITGADSGIGQGIAKAFAESGADVAIGYRSDAEGAAHTAELVEAAGRKALVLQGDLAIQADVDRMFATFDETFGHLDIMVNNAGLGRRGAVHEIDIADWDYAIQVNLYGTFRCSAHAARRMIAQGYPGGRIINITSVHQEACNPNSSAYDVSKAGVRNLTRVQALELAPYGVTVNNIAPGMILTPMNQRAIDDPEHLAWVEAQIPMLRGGLPADIANMATFLASEAASYCTGSTFFVDGGWMLTQPPV